MHANNVCHFAIHAQDVDRARKFYENVFGWEFSEWGPPDFYLIKTGNEQSPGIAGALQRRQEEVASGVGGFECSISIEDIKATTEAIVAHGGTIVHPEVEIPTVGILVKFADTEGNVSCAIQYSKERGDFSH